MPFRFQNTRKGKPYHKQQEGDAHAGKDFA
jgi:hypothetical protein